MSEHSLTKRIRAKRLPPEERRQTVIAAALPLLVRSGESLIVSEVAEAAGVAEGTVFKVFPTRDTLIRACLEAAIDTSSLASELSKSRGSKSLPAAQDLVLIGHTLRRYFIDSLRVTRSIGMPKAEGLELGTKRLFEGVDRVISDEFSNRPALIKSAVSSEAFKMSFISTIYASASRELAQMNQPSIEDLIQILTAGLKEDKA